MIQKSRVTTPHNVQLITTAVVSGVVVGSAILGLQKAMRMYRIRELKASIPDLDSDHYASRVSRKSDTHIPYLLLLLPLACHVTYLWYIG